MAGVNKAGLVLEDVSVYILLVKTSMSVIVSSALSTRVRECRRGGFKGDVRC